MTPLHEIEQKKLCGRFGAKYSASSPTLKVGMSRNVHSGEQPINGLRHKPLNGTTGWYIWAGAYSESDDFFRPVHVSHLIEMDSKIVKYLGLAPGWRFQFDDRGYEDCWYDKDLLDPQE